ncbi:uncharacterized protein LOC129615142 isoform X2 [Condylostylus longicornis]|uniref:uncharacterized protein LOC129615142 isoform X2 n=1 Tax=Condylostylus longicornis TaxID=2530218 RepID=UPI00244E096F|nr:uncharacterized protein LOC129615142 isoform X2 [Condylostylus longicornis]
MEHRNMTMKHFIFAVILILLADSVNCKEKEHKEVKYGDKINLKEKDLMRKSIVFDKKTPDVFYCPMQKPSNMNKLIVRSRPLHKLCEYEGQSLPTDYKSDCYKDIDESDYACKEKYRIMKRFATEEIIANKKK